VLLGIRLALLPSIINPRSSFRMGKDHAGLYILVTGNMSRRLCYNFLLLFESKTLYPLGWAFRMITWKNLGTVGGVIEIVPYNPEWAELFELEARRIRTVCEGKVTIVEHIGSTAIPGMPAKPILDIMPGLASYQDGLKTIGPLKRLGYEYFGENGIPGRFYFNFSFEGRSVAHVHIFEIGTENWHRHLIFRDHLRADPAIAAQYAELKKELAASFRNDREAYTNGKSEFINLVVQRARSNMQGKNA
jgi:GrpB-like predicted nucleotidyltransferase (UPF0157 family)